MIAFCNTCCFQNSCVMKAFGSGECRKFIQAKVSGETSDGYHTFNELYHHRAILFSMICRQFPELAWKSKLHHDGTMHDDMFIVGINTPNGQASYHYDIEPYWSMFAVKELGNAPEWDGYTPAQAIERIGSLRPQESHLLTLDELQQMDGDKIYIHYIGACEGFYEDAFVPYFGKHEQYVDEYNGMVRACDLPLKYYNVSWVAYDRPPGGDRR